MLGPVFNREAILAPKRPQTYLSRSLYVLVLFLLLCTGYLVLAGTRPLQTAGDSARLGAWMFAILVPLQLIVVTFQSAIGAASNIAQEKDRRTFILLLLTRLNGFELVVGKLVSSLIPVFQSLFAATPLFLIMLCLGGISIQQFIGAYAVTISMAAFSASVGTLMALWREKTFQTIAVTVLVIVLWVGCWEIIAAGLIPMIPSSLALFVSPIGAIESSITPIPGEASSAVSRATGFSLVTCLLSVLVTWLGIWKIRVWNPTRELRMTSASADDDGQSKASWKVRDARGVWNNPVLWREICTRAYGRKLLFIRFAYVTLFAITAVTLWKLMGVDVHGAHRDALPIATLPLAAIGVVSLAIINALAVNSVTNERDGLALDLLLATDLKPKEFIFGKILGVLFVTKEMVILPIMLIGYVWWTGNLSQQNLVFTITAASVLYIFVATLGIHCGLNYANSRSALLTSLGTVFFLCLGIAICMVIMVSFRGAFQIQLAPFLAIILGGGVGLLASLGKRNPSPAISIASFELPLATFYAITTFLLQRDQLWVVFAVVMGYGFATLAMLIPALSDFDIAMGHSHSRMEDGE